MELAIVVCLINMKLSIKLHKDEELAYKFCDNQYPINYMDEVNTKCIDNILIDIE